MSFHLLNLDFDFFQHNDTDLDGSNRRVELWGVQNFPEIRIKGGFGDDGATPVQCRRRGSPVGRTWDEAPSLIE